MNYREGQTATSRDGKRRLVFRGGAWVNDDTFTSREKTSATDQKALQEANSKAQVERDALRQYQEASDAVDTMGTGPIKAWWLDTIYPQPDGGLGDSLGAAFGTPFRLLVPAETEQARDHLKTIEAGTSITASTELKGPATDRDMALIRLTGVNPYKTEEENKRIIRDARYQSGLEQVRARVTAMWINKYGSLSAPSSNGKSFTEILEVAENEYTNRMNRGRGGRPSAPPSARRNRESDVITIDLDGNPVK